MNEQVLEEADPWKYMFRIITQFEGRLLREILFRIEEPIVSNDDTSHPERERKKENETAMFTRGRADGNRNRCLSAASQPTSDSSKSTTTFTHIIRAAGYSCHSTPLLIQSATTLFTEHASSRITGYIFQIYRGLHCHPIDLLFPRARQKVPMSLR